MFEPIKSHISPIAFLILAHTEPALLRRLALALHAPWARFFIHVDRKSDIAAFKAALWDIPGIVLIDERIKVHWGGWSMVKATLNLLEAAIRASPPAQRFVLLSGACYPIRDNTTLRDFLLKNDKEYIDAVKMPNEEEGKPLSLLTQWHFERGHRAFGPVAFVIQQINKLGCLVPYRNVRKGLNGRIPYAGSTWWALTRGTAEEILRVANAEPQFVRLYKYSACPDESFFHTILLNGARKNNICRSLTYVDWPHSTDSPCAINEGHLPLLLSSSTAENAQPIFFARKFSAKNVHILDRIDEYRCASSTIRQASSNDANH
ncbi:MAG TPA: beta-1,6-N-acetylglucosaminyltransferase [Candidatus Sulfotelmatobacter sp.]|nr:beta-1,6-N-acetylglucosaminyltransferase [Candidatus Sulfotelmatobacter sp.]